MRKHLPAMSPKLNETKLQKRKGKERIHGCIGVVVLSKGKNVLCLGTLLILWLSHEVKNKRKDKVESLQVTGSVKICYVYLSSVMESN